MEPVLVAAFVEDFCRWREIPQIEQLARHSRVPAVAAAQMATPPPFDGLHAELPAGAAMDHPLFPVVWPA